MEIQIRKNDVKKVLAFFMAVLMLFGCLPVSGVMAVDVSNVNATQQVTAGNVALSGVCGDNAYYTLDDEGCLRIYGEGDMYDFYDEMEDSTIPWHEFSQ